MDDLAEGQVVAQHHPVTGLVLHVAELSASLLAELHHRPDVHLGHHDRRLGARLLDRLDVGGVGEHLRVVDGEHAAVAQPHPVLDGRRGGDQREPELALEPLLDDLHVEQAEEAAAEAEAERRRGLRLPHQRGVVEVELLERLLEFLDVLAVDREDAGEDHRRRLPVAGQRRGCGPLGVGDGVADPAVADVLDGGDDVADLAGAQLLDWGHHRPEHADLVDDEVAAAVHHPHAHPRLDGAVDDTDVDHDAAVDVVLAVEDQRLEGRVGIALGGRHPLHHRLEDVAGADALARTREDGLVAG